MSTFWIGTKVRVSGVFKDLDGAAVDPSSVTFKFRSPASVVTTYVYGVAPELVKDDLGTYHVDVDGSAAGTWRYRWESTGTYQAAEEGAFEITASKVA